MRKRIKKGFFEFRYFSRISERDEVEERYRYSCWKYYEVNWKNIFSTKTMSDVM
jgi:hypothetical protein